MYNLKVDLPAVLCGLASIGIWLAAPAQAKIVESRQLERIRAGTVCVQTMIENCPLDAPVGHCITQGVCADDQCVNYANVYYTMVLGQYTVCIGPFDIGDYYCSPWTNAVCYETESCYQQCDLNNAQYDCATDPSTIQDSATYTYPSNFSETSGCGQAS